jgi:hypothetical protein
MKLSKNEASDIFELIEQYLQSKNEVPIQVPLDVNDIDSFDEWLDAMQ